MNVRTVLLIPLTVLLLGYFDTSFAQRKDARDYGISLGVMNPGPRNTITDVPEVSVGHFTLDPADSIRTGVTAILPHPGNIFQEKVPGAIYVGNGFGKLTGITQVEELGTIETPIILTNTLSVPTAASALIDYTFSFPENIDVRSVNPIVGETNDGWLNDIRGRHITVNHVLRAIGNASSGEVAEGNVGAGRGTSALGYKGGIGTSSRVLPESLGGYTVGVLVQSNFGGVLQIAGVPVGKELGNYAFRKNLKNPEEGSCMIVVATDAPILHRNLKRLAKRAIIGLGKTGGIMSNGSGDYVIAFSTSYDVRVPYRLDKSSKEVNILRNESVSALFLAVIEATEEAILNSLFHAETTVGRDQHTINALPIDEVIKILKNYGRITNK